MSETNIDKLKLKIDILELNLKQLEQELELLKSSNELDKELNEISRVEKGDYFYSIFIGDKIKWVRNLELNDVWCDYRYNAGNYFKSEEKVQDFASKIAFLFNIQKLHDIYCPDYEPDWSVTNKRKYFIRYDTVYNKYRIDFVNSFKSDSEVYFPNLEISQKVCDILNKELDINE